MDAAAERQRTDALAKANRFRVAKKRIRLECRSGDRLVSDLIAATPEECGGARLASLLSWAPGIGTVKAANICRAMRINPNRLMRNLHPLERRRLVGRIEEYETQRKARRERYVAIAA